MTTAKIDADTIAARHNGTPRILADNESAPLHCWMDRDSAYQFPSALDLVAFMRELGSAHAALR